MEKMNRSFTLEELQALPSDKLNAMVRAELESSNHNEALILQMLRILEQRDPLDALRAHPIVQDARAKFQAYYIASAERASHERRRRTGNLNRWLIRAASAAAILCILLLAVPRAFGAENAWELLCRWTSDLFSFFDPTKGVQEEAGQNFHSDNPDLQEVYEAVTEHGAEKPIVPQWIPEGYTMTELKVTSSPDGTKIYARFVNGDNVLVFSLEHCDEVTSNKYIKDEIDADIYELAGVKYHFITNKDYLSIAWNIDKWECLITSDLEEETLQKIVDSIYQEAN